MPAPKETTRHLEAFEVWYSTGRDFRETSLKLAKPDRSLREWAARFYWVLRADERDEAVAEKARKAAIDRKVKTLEDHRKAGQLLRSRGTQFFVSKEIDRASDAIAAVKAGVELERQAEGLPDWIGKLLAADADTLQQEFADLDARRRAVLAGSTTGDGEEESPVP